MSGKKYGIAIVDLVNLMPIPLAKNFVAGILSSLYPCKKFLDHNKNFKESDKERHNADSLQNP